MKTNLLLHRFIFAALGFMLLLLTGCGGGGSSAPAGFAADQVAGKNFAYASVPDAAHATATTGALAFNADGTWRSMLAATVFSGTWTIDANGHLVCVTTAGGDHTITYTLLEATTGVLKVSAVEVNPAAPGNPTSYTATFSNAFAIEMIAGQKLSYASGTTTSKGVIEFGHDGAWQATTDTATYSGIWNVVDGKLVCVTTTGGDHTITYTRLDAIASPLRTSASEVSPSAPNSPVISTVTFTVMDVLVTVGTPKIFNFNVTFKNLPESLPQTESTTPNYTVIPQRRQWALFIPRFVQPMVSYCTQRSGCKSNDTVYRPDNLNLSSAWGVHIYPNGIPEGTPVAGPVVGSDTKFNSNPVANTTVSFGFVYGSTILLETIDNYFYFKVTYPTTTGGGEFSTPLMGFLIWDTPANSSWEYDYADNSMKRIN